MKKAFFLSIACLAFIGANAQKFAKYFDKAGPEQAMSVIQTLDGGFAVAGYETTAADTGIFLSKVNLYGVTEWTKSYSTPSNEVSTNVGLIQLADSSYVLASSTSFGALKTKSLLFRVGKNGNLMWNQINECDILNEDSLSNFNSIKLLSNGNLLVAGINGCSNFERQAFYRVYDSLGTILAGIQYSNPAGERYEFADAIETKDGGFLFVGGHNINDVTNGTNGTSALAVKTDALGIIDWSFKFDGVGGGFDSESFHAVAEMPDSSFVITGLAENLVGQNAGFLSRIRKDGATDWLFRTPFATDGFKFSSIGVIDSGSFFVGGYRSTLVDTNIFVAKVDTDGTYLEGAAIPSLFINTFSDYRANQSVILDDIQSKFYFAGYTTGGQNAALLESVQFDVVLGCEGFALPLGAIPFFANPTTLTPVININSNSLLNLVQTDVVWGTDTIDCYCSDGPYQPDTVDVCVNGFHLFAFLPGDSIKWSPAIDLSCTDCPNPTVSPTASRMYYYTVDTASTCGYSGSVYVRTTAPNQFSLGQDTTVCASDSLVLYGGDYDSYLWQDGSTDSAFIVGVGSTTGWYHLFAMHGPCTVADSIFITVSNPAFIAGTDTIDKCRFDSLQLNVFGGLTYSWSPNLDISCLTCPNPKVANTVPRYYYVLIDSAAGCNTYDSVFVDTLSPPYPDLGPDSTVCSDAGFTLNPGVFSSYLWQDGTMGGAYPINSTSSTGWYHCTVTSGTCTGIDSVFITVIPAPFVNLGPDKGVCPGDSTFLDASSSPGPYLWQDGSTSPFYYANGPGDYWVEVINGGCTYRDSIVINLLPAPAPNLGGDTVICEGEVFLINPGSGFSSYLWHNNTMGSNFQVSAGVIGSTSLYYVDVTNNFGCTERDSLFVTTAAAPTVSFDTNFYSLCEGQILPITALVSSNDSIRWNNGTTGETLFPDSGATYTIRVYNNGCFVEDTVFVLETPIPFVDLGPDTAICAGEMTYFPAITNAFLTWGDNTSNHNAFRFINEPGIYWVGAANGCGQFRDSIVILDLGCECNIWAPNVFTPNNDLENDVFIPNIDCELINYRLDIYNRWGEPVRSVTNQDEGWDGRINGEPATEGVYFWTIDAESLSGKESVSGYVSLYR